MTRVSSVWLVLQERLEVMCLMECDISWRFGRHRARSHLFRDLFRAEEIGLFSLCVCVVCRAKSTLCLHSKAAPFNSPGSELLVPVWPPTLPSLLLFFRSLTPLSHPQHTYTRYTTQENKNTEHTHTHIYPRPRAEGWVWVMTYSHKASNQDKSSTEHISMYYVSHSWLEFLFLGQLQG